MKAYAISVAIIVAIAAIVAWIVAGMRCSGIIKKAQREIVE